MSNYEYFYKKKLKLNFITIGMNISKFYEDE